jgi:hypothetical protein
MTLRPNWSGTPSNPDYTDTEITCIDQSPLWLIPVLFQKLRPERRMMTSVLREAELLNFFALHSGRREASPIFSHYILGEVKLRLFFRIVRHPGLVARSKRYPGLG